MSHYKRLFLFAGFNADGKIDDALVYYIQNLAKFGDVILCMDSNCPIKELNKVKEFTIARFAKRHGEYDFGSYKRGFQYAYDNNILKDYDVLYLVNDSVYGPTIDLTNTIQSIEQIPTDAASITVSKHKTHIFMESWFIRLNKNIFTAIWFNNFMQNVTHEKNKADITVKYEHGLSNLIRDNGLSWSGLFIKYGRFTYNRPKYLFKHRCPFIKKMSFTRHNGALGRQIKYILNHCDTNAKKAIINSANELYGKQYMLWFLTTNPIKTGFRAIKYAQQKIKNGGI